MTSYAADLATGKRKNPASAPLGGPIPKEVLRGQAQPFSQPGPSTGRGIGGEGRTLNDCGAGLRPIHYLLNEVAHRIYDFIRLGRRHADQGF